MKAESEYGFEESFMYVWAPAIVEYVEWVLADAIASGKKKLYFLARDGWMMYHIAQKIIDRRALDIEARYLKVSRYAIRSAEYCLLGEESLELICVGGIDISFEKLMKRALLTDEEARHIAALSGYEEKYKTILNYRQIQDLKEKLKEIKQLFIYIEQHSKLNYENTIGYLTQEGLLEDTPYALVDSGWIGTLQMSIQHLLSAGFGEERRIYGYYYGLYNVPKNVAKEQYKSFYFGQKSVWRKVYFSNCLFETVLSSPDGMTVGYSHEGEKFVAIESANPNPNANELMQFKNLALIYADEYLRGECGQKRPCKALARLMSKPTQEEARLYGKMKFCDDIIEHTLQPLAAEWKTKDIKKQRFINKLLIKMNIRKQELHESAWPEGSITNHGGMVCWNLMQERMYKIFMYTRKAIVGK